MAVVTIVFVYYTMKTSTFTWHEFLSSIQPITQPDSPLVTNLLQIKVHSYLQSFPRIPRLPSEEFAIPRGLKYLDLLEILNRTTVLRYTPA